MRVPRGLVLFGLACVILGAACGATTGGGSDDRGGVLVLGDSIAVGARDLGDLAGELRDDGWTPDIVAIEGVPPVWALDVLSQRERVPATVVLVLGSNPSPEVANIAAEVRLIVDDLTSRGARRILWVPPYAADLYVERARALRAALADRSEVTVLPWDVELASHDEWFAPDNLHLTDDGYEALADFITASLRA